MGGGEGEAGGGESWKLRVEGRKRFGAGLAKMRVIAGLIIENNRKSIFYSCAFSLVNYNYDNCKTTRL